MFCKYVWNIDRYLELFFRYLHFVFICYLSKIVTVIKKIVIKSLALSTCWLNVWMTTDPLIRKNKVLYLIFLFSLLAKKKKKTIIRNVLVVNGLFIALFLFRHSSATCIDECVVHSLNPYFFLSRSFFIFHKNCIFWCTCSLWSVFVFHFLVKWKRTLESKYRFILDTFHLDIRFLFFNFSSLFGFCIVLWFLV